MQGRQHPGAYAQVIRTHLRIAGRAPYLYTLIQWRSRLRTLNCPAYGAHHSGSKGVGLAKRIAEIAGARRCTRMPRLQLVLLLLAWPVLLLAAQAQPGTLRIERLTRPLPPAQIRADPGTLPWQPVSDVPVRVGEGWLRLTVQGPLPVARPLYLVMPRRGTARVEVYLPNRVEPLVSDEYTGPYRADVSTRLHVFEIDRLMVGDRIYVRATGMRVALLQPTLMTHEALLETDRVPAALAAAWRTLTLLAAASLLGCAVWRREGLYLAGGAYVLLWLAFNSANDGSLYTLPGLAWLAALHVTGPWLLALGATILLTVFARLLLRLPARTPRLDRLLVALMPLFAIIALVAQLPAARPWLLALANVTNALLMLDTLALLAAAALAARRGARYAPAFLLAWAPVAATIFTDALAAMRVVDLSQDIGLYLLAISAFCGALFALMSIERATLRERLLRMPGGASSTGIGSVEGLLQRLCLLAREGVVPRFALLLIHPGEPSPVGGTLRGDARAAVLQHTTALLRTELREYDRYGPCDDEVVMALLPDGDGAAAAATAERLRTRAQRTPLTLVGVDVHVAPSVGSAIGSEAASDPAALRLAAERALQVARETAAAR